MTVLLIIVVVALLLSMTDPGTGFVMVAAIGEGFMAARSSPLMLLAAFLLLFGYWVAGSDRSPADGTRSAGIARRAVAYVIDLMVVFAILPAILAVPLLWAEAQRTGAFAWSFERPELVPTDVTVGMPLLLLAVILLNLYFAYPLVLGTQTPGCRLLGFRIIDFDEEDRVPWGRAVLRSLLAFLAAVVFFITIPLALWSGERGVLWHDEMMDTRAVLLGRGR